MEFKCSICNYTSNQRTHLEQHSKRKILCGDGDLVILEIMNEVECDFCNKTFTLNSTCKVKKINIEKELLLEKDKVSKLEKELAVAKALANKPNTTINNNQTNVIINLAPWNDPKLPKDVEKYYKEAVKKIFLAIPTLIKFIHFNSEHPENHNICIKNGRSKTAKVYNGKEWETIDEDRLIRTLIDDYESTLECYAEDNNPKYLEKIKEIKDRDTEEKVYDDLHMEVKRVIYDRNYMVKIKN